MSRRATLSVDYIYAYYVFRRSEMRTVASGASQDLRSPLEGIGQHCALPRIPASCACRRHEHALNWREINGVLFVAAAAAAIWFLGGARNPYVTGIGVICVVVGGFPIHVLDPKSKVVAQKLMILQKW